MFSDDPTDGRPARRFSAASNLLQDSGYSGLVLERLVRHVCRVAEVQRVCIFVRDRNDPGCLIAAAAHGSSLDLLGSRFGAEQGILGRVLSAGEPVLVSDCQAVGPIAPAFADDATRAAFAPIRSGAAVGGVLAAAVCDEHARLDDGQFRLLCELADIAAAALDHAGPHGESRGEVDAHVEALARAMVLCDKQTADHAEDVVVLARMVGQMLHLDEAALVELEFAARLHDVGKIRVPTEILNKAGPLDAREREIMRCHSGWGAEALFAVPGLEVVATIVRFHHERWDGTGYPDRLCGARIPLASRIIAVCDAFGAMICDRPYRSGMPAPDAVEELRAGAGSQFDPAVVDAFCEAVSTHAPAVLG